MNPTRPLALLLGAVLAAGLLGGCSADEDERPTGSGALVDLSALYPAPGDRLSPALRIDGTTAVRFDGGGPSPGPGSTTVSDEGVAVVATDAGVSAYDANTHAQVWDTALDGPGACQVSQVVDGLVAVVTGARYCSAVTVLDARTGVERWRRDLGDPSLVSDTTLALGPGSVYASGECGSVLRFDPATGRPQEPMLAADDVCGHSNDSEDGVVALWEDPESPDTPDEVAPGWIPPYDGVGRFRVVDVRTDRTLVSRTVDRDATDLNGVVSTDPLVLDVTERGQRTLQRYDDDGEPVGTLGARLDAGDDFSVWAQTRGVLVGSYSGVPGYFAYDVGTGEELWRTAGDRWLAGADSRGLVWTQTVRVTRDGEVVEESQAVRSSTTDPEDAELLGALPGPGLGSLVVGNDLLLDDDGNSPVIPLGEATGPAPAPYDAWEEQLGWGPDDLRTAETLDYCDAVATEDLEVVGLRTDLPAPADCHWSEGDDPSYLEKSLSVDVAVSVPGLTEDGEPATGADMAAVAYAGERRRWAPLDGLGDEARARSTQSGTGQAGSAAVDVRAGNVVVSVQSAVVALTPERTSGAVPAARLEQVVLDVAADVLAGLGLPVDPDVLPEPGEAGPVTEAPDVCRTVGALGTEVAGPLASRADHSSDDPTQSSCSWGVDVDEPGVDLQVTAFALLPGVLPGTDGGAPSAVEAARAVRFEGRPYPDAGPDARLRSTDDPDDSRSRALSVREDNLVVRVVAYAYAEPLPDPEALDADLVRVAERVLDAARG